MPKSMYEQAAAKLEAEKKASAAKRKKAAKAVKKVKSQPRPEVKSKNPAAGGRSALSSLAEKVRKEMKKYSSRKSGIVRKGTPVKPMALKAVRGNIADKKKALQNNLTEKELARFRRK